MFYGRNNAVLGGLLKHMLNGNSFEPLSHNCLKYTQRFFNGVSSLVSQKYKHVDWDFFYNQPQIDIIGSKESCRFTPVTLLYTARDPEKAYILNSAKYLRKELPVRIAHRILGFRQLPFVVACNPNIRQCHQMYIDTFKVLADVPEILDFETEAEFTRTLRNLLYELRDVVTLLAVGFSEVTKFSADKKVIKTFLDNMLTSRLGVRILAEHHVALHVDKPHHVGIINKRFSPYSVLLKTVDIVTQMCRMRYGEAPSVRIDGHVSSTFPYIAMPLEYILVEILKNSFRATVEHHAKRDKSGNISTSLSRNKLPNVHVTISTNENDIVIRVSDRGGGISASRIDSIFEYHVTDSASSAYGRKSEKTVAEPNNAFDHMLNYEVSRAVGQMHGYGFGLPTCRAYANYLKGSLTIESMEGIGSDTYITLRNIEGNKESFRI